MIKLLLGCLLILACINAQALEVFSYKNTGSNAIVKRDQASLETLWVSDTPACIKDGSKILGVNKSFKTKKLGYRDCSSSDSAIAKQELLGYKVEVIKLTELPTDIAKKLMGIK